MRLFIMRRTVALLSLMIWTSDHADAQAHPPQGFADWANAQLIFQDDGRAISRALQAATGRSYTHVGMVRITGGGPVVLDTSPSLWENFVEEFLEHSEGGRYAVYELRGLSETAGFTPPRVANDYLNTPDDPFLRPGKTELSGAELARIGFEAIGVRLGKTTTFESLAARTPEIRAFFHATWHSHPECTGRAEGEEACWAIVRRQKILTPASLADDPRLVCVWSNFEADQDRCPGPR